MSSRDRELSVKVVLNAISQHHQITLSQAEVLFENVLSEYDDDYCEKPRGY
jgi:hypothetical protein